MVRSLVACRNHARLGCTPLTGKNTNLCMSRHGKVRRYRTQVSARLACPGQVPTASELSWKLSHPHCGACELVHDTTTAPPWELGAGVDKNCSHALDRTLETHGAGRNWRWPSRRGRLESTRATNSARRRPARSAGANGTRKRIEPKPDGADPAVRAEPKSLDQGWKW